MGGVVAEPCGKEGSLLLPHTWQAVCRGCLSAIYCGELQLTTPYWSLLYVRADLSKSREARALGMCCDLKWTRSDAVVCGGVLNGDRLDGGVLDGGVDRSGCVVVRRVPPARVYQLIRTV